MVSSRIFFDQYGDVWDDGRICFRLFQGGMVRYRAAVRKYGLDLQRLCDCYRGFDTPPDLDRVDDRREAGISDDCALLAQTDRHSGGALFPRGNGNIIGPDAQPVARPARL